MVNFELLTENFEYLIQVFYVSPYALVWSVFPDHLRSIYIKLYSSLKIF